MKYKEDWDKAKERLEAWWKGEIIDRVVIQVTAPRKNARKISSKWEAWMIAHNLGDPEMVIDEFEKYCSEIYYGGEAFPLCWMNFGAGSMAAYLGANTVVNEDTVWFESPEGWRDKLQDIKFDPDNKWWKLTREFMSVSSEKGRGKFITGTTDIGGILDILASLRGSQNLLLDLLDNGGRVKEISGHITSKWYDIYQELYGIARDKGMEGTSNWMGLWSPKRCYPLQCDFSAMISPEMFKEFVFSDLQAQCRYLDHSVYHWDGPGQLPHLDLLLDIPELNGIQWTPGAGQPGLESPKWIPLYKRIQEKKKLVILVGVPAAKIEGLLKEISPKGVLIVTYDVNSEDEARDLLKKAEKWSI